MGAPKSHDFVCDKITKAGFSEKYVAYFSCSPPLLFENTNGRYQYVADILHCKADYSNRLKRGIAALPGSVKLKMSTSCLQYNELLMDEVQAQKIVNPKLPAYHRAKIATVIENADGELEKGEKLSYAVLEFAEGVSLQRALAMCESAIEKQKLMQSTLQSCLSFYKRRKFFPTDLSGGNVIVNDQGRIKLIDYGSYYRKGELYGTTQYTDSGYTHQANHPTKHALQTALELFFLQYVRIYNDAVEGSNIAPLPNCQELFFRFWEAANWSVEDCFETYLAMVSGAAQENIRAVAALKKHIMRVRRIVEKQIERLDKINSSPIAVAKKDLFESVLAQLPAMEEVQTLDANNLYRTMDKLSHGLNTLKEGLKESLTTKQVLLSSFKILPKEVQVLIEIFCWITVIGKIIKAIIDGIDKAPSRSENGANKALLGYRPLIARRNNSQQPNQPRGVVATN